MRLQPGSGIVSRPRDAEPSFLVGSDTEGRMQSPDELRQESEALRDRISRLSAAILRINESLDASAVLREVFERACRLSRFDPYPQSADVLVPSGRFGSWPELINCTFSGSVREGGSEMRNGQHPAPGPVRNSRNPAPVRSKLMRLAETRPRRFHRSGNSLSGRSDSRSPDSGKRGGRGTSPPRAS